jgi:hypothetical protein
VITCKHHPLRCLHRLDPSDTRHEDLLDLCLD